MDRVDISSLELRDYTQSMGWKLVKEALKDDLFVLNSPGIDHTQLIFPKDAGLSGFDEMAAVSLDRLSEYYNKKVGLLVDEIREVNDDVVCLRYYSDNNKIVNSISFEEACESMVATRQMILSAASTVVNPVIFHPKLNRTEPQDLIRKAKFRHTQEGSFIIKVSIPFEATGNSNSLFKEDEPEGGSVPLSRQTFEVISLSSHKILETIDANAIVDLYKEQHQSTTPLISYNFCDSLSKLFDDDRELPFELVFNWSKASLINLPAPRVPSRIAFTFSYKGKLEELKGYFAPEKQEIADVFYGTVEALNGEPGPDGRRLGEVTFALLIDTEIVRARASLNVEQYQTAIRAHEKGGAYIMLKANLNRCSRVGKIDNIIEFRLAQSESVF